MVRLVIEARPLWDELQDDAGEILLEEIGALDHGNPAAVDALTDAMAVAGVPFERLPPDAAAERWPHLRFEGAVVHQPTAGRCLADAAVAALLQKAEEHGADVRCGWGRPRSASTVRPACRPAGDRLGGRRGGDGRRLDGQPGRARNLGRPAAPGTRVTEEQLVHFPPAVERDEWERWASVIHHTDRFWYALPSPGVGLKVGGHHEGDVIDPDRRRDGPDPDYVDGLVRYVEVDPGRAAEPMAGTCLYDDAR